jgi:hypothetical protein
MHKPILFLLVASLIMLLPFGTSLNIISKVMALNIVPSMNNDDEQDYMQRYEKFYEDDSFREAYYNYHKQHHQQIENKEQSSISQEPKQHHHHHHHQKQIEKEVQESISQKLQQQKQNSLTESLPQPGGLTASNTSTRGLEPSFSPPIIAQETGDLSALEKIEKLKQQWMELTP